MARAAWCSVLTTATILVVALSAGLGVLSSDAPQPTQATVRDRGADAVTVTATWLGVQEDRLAVRLGACPGKPLHGRRTGVPKNRAAVFGVV